MSELNGLVNSKKPSTKKPSGGTTVIKVEGRSQLHIDQESGLIIGTQGAGRGFHTIDIPLTAADGRP